jgi:hypothetical protein
VVTSKAAAAMTVRTGVPQLLSASHRCCGDESISVLTADRDQTSERKYLERMDSAVRPYKTQLESCWVRASSGPSLWTCSDQPSQILRSARLAETFVRLGSWFDWIVVDSTPMSPMVDANLWS